MSKEPILYLDRGMKIFKVNSIAEPQLLRLGNKAPKMPAKAKLFGTYGQTIQHYRDTDILISYWNGSKKLEGTTATLKLPESVLLLFTQLSQQLKQRGVRQKGHWAVYKGKYVSSVTFMNEKQVSMYKELNNRWVSQDIYWHQAGKQVDEERFREWFE